MGQLRRAITLIAVIIVFASPCAAKILKFEILQVSSPAFEGEASVLSASVSALMPDCLSQARTRVFTGATRAG
jgi:hypothetical protein